MDVDLDSTLGCGQAHRWKKCEKSWYGVLQNEVVKLTQTDFGFICEGTEDTEKILKYFRSNDDLNSIYSECARHDKLISELISKCKGLRLLNQEHWECISTYILATNANVKRIGKMVENVCKEFGKELHDGYFSFPSPEEILSKKDCIGNCKLGFRAERIIEFAEMVVNKKIDLNALEKLSYEELIKELIRIKGVGPKVADCIALFSYNHLDAFPIDVRIMKIMKEKYKIEGSYKEISEKSRKKFGKYAGYSQEFLYHFNAIED